MIYIQGLKVNRYKTDINPILTPWFKKKQFTVSCLLFILISFHYKFIYIFIVSVCITMKMPSTITIKDVCSRKNKKKERFLEKVEGVKSVPFPVNFFYCYSDTNKGNRAMHAVYMIDRRSAEVKPISVQYLFLFLVATL